MTSHRVRASVLVAFTSSVAVAFAASATAGPTAGTSAPPVTTPGPQPTAKPVVPRIVGVRVKPGAEVYTDGRLPWEIQIDNPLPSRQTVTAVIADPPGSADYDLGPNEKRWVTFSRAALMDACTPKQAWTMWLAATPDDKRVFEMTPNCTFKAAPALVASTPTVSSTTPTVVPPKISYANPKVKSTAPVCGQPLSVEADVTNRTGGKYTYVYLDLGPFQTNQHFSLENGETKRVSAGQSQFGGARGRFPLLLRAPAGGANNPDVAQGSFVAQVQAECRPTFQMRGFVATP